MRLLHLQKRGDDGHLFLAKFEGWGEVPFKLPSVSRSRQYTAALLLAETPADLATFHEYIFRECVVDDKIQFEENMPAGIVKSIAELVMYLSGAHQDRIPYTEGLMNNYRSAVNDPINFMKRTICSVFSGYTFKSLGELDYQTLVGVFVNAERMMLEAGLIESPYQFETEEEERKPRMPMVPMGPSGPGRAPSDNMSTESNSRVDVDALIQDGIDMMKEDRMAPAKGAHNLHDNPEYKARKEATFDRLNKMAGR